jgi:endonuclease III
LIDNVRRPEQFPAKHRAASELVATNPFAFALAVSLQRGISAEVIWTFPYDLRAALGHLDPARIAAMSLDNLDRVIRGLPNRPRYVNDAPRTARELSRLVVEEYGGDASRIWTDRSAADVKAAFRSLYGVGQGIADLAVLLLEDRYGLRFSDSDHRDTDIKPDMHTRRVLHRLGVAADASPDEALAAARRLHPSFPGDLDAPLVTNGAPPQTWIIQYAQLRNFGARCTTA